MKEKKSPYTFKTQLNTLGHTVVYLVKGKNKVWLFNITNKILDFGTVNNKNEYKNVGLDTTEDDYGNVIPLIEGLNQTNTHINERLKNLESILERVFNV